MTTLFWHRQDLRTRDNIGLIQAAQNEDAIPVYVRDPSVHGNLGVNQKAFVEQGLQKLDDKYRELGSGLVVSDGNTAEQLQELADSFNADNLLYNKAIDPRRKSVAENVEEAFDDTEIETRSFQDRLLVDPSKLEPSYPSFSQFYNDWKEEPKKSAVRSPREGELVEVDSSVPEPSQPEADLPEAGYDGANQRFTRFLDNKIKHYKDERDNMRDIGVSKMSMYISNGMMGMREILERAVLRMDGAGSDGRRNIAKYRNELGWREWFQYLMYYNPETVQENYKDMKPVEWRDNPEHLQAWKRGETGVPMVDAGMRQMLNEGYMHNRTRQNVASFLTKHLLIDWREGARHFEEKLADHDTASNYGSWQWSASTGTDSVDVRIFSPVKQGRKVRPRSRLHPAPRRRTRGTRYGRHPRLGQEIRPRAPAAPGTARNQLPRPHSELRPALRRGQKGVQPGARQGLRP
jgi:Deoxyribodipyrimidine photolyase